MPHLLRVVATEWQLEISGAVPRIPTDILANASTRVTVSDSSQIEILNPTTGTLEPYQPNVDSLPLFFENVEYDVHLRVQSSGYNLYASGLSPLDGTAVFPDGTVQHLRLRFANEVGFAEVFVDKPQGRTTLRFEVFPTKLNYRTDYVAMRDEIASIARQLVMAVQRSTFGAAVPEPIERPTLNEWLTLMRRYFSELHMAVAAVLIDPRTQLQRSLSSVRVERSRILPSNVLDRYARHPPRDGVFVPPGIALPKRVTHQHHRLSFNTPENRYLKALLIELKRRLLTTIQTHTSGDEDSDQTAEQKFFDAVRPDCRRMLERVNSALAHSMFAEVSTGAAFVSTSLVLQMHPHYARAAKLARLIMSGLSLTGGPLAIGIKNIALLYEYWCFLALADLLRGRLHLKSQDLIKLTHTRVTLVLAKGQRSRLQFLDENTNRTFWLVYNRMFDTLPTISQQPDNIIQIGEGDEHLYILDAKYRVRRSSPRRAASSSAGAMGAMCPSRWTNTAARWSSASSAKRTASTSSASSGSSRRWKHPYLNVRLADLFLPVFGEPSGLTGRGG